MGEIIIDGTNVSNTLGILVSEGGYLGVVSLPEIKDVDFNDWAEEDGIEVDLTNVKIKSKDVDIDFVTKNRNADVASFVSLITDGAYHDFYFPDLGVTKKLRLVSGVDFEGKSNEMRQFTLKFSEDNPMFGYSYAAPVGGSYPEQGYTIDLIDLSQYGIAVLKDTESELLRVADVKKNVEVNNRFSNGVIYDALSVKFKSKDIKLNLLMSSKLASNFIRNLNALTYNLTKSGERKLSACGQNLRCYYLKSEPKYFSASTPLWFEFSIILRVIGNE